MEVCVWTEVATLTTLEGCSQALREEHSYILVHPNVEPKSVGIYSTNEYELVKFSIRYGENN
ncbi:MAG: hypothetical protein ACRBCI_12565, partial [Cellvibrionaceae bacterium]